MCARIEVFKRDYTTNTRLLPEEIGGTTRQQRDMNTTNTRHEHEGNAGSSRVRRRPSGYRRRFRPWPTGYQGHRAGRPESRADRNSEFSNHPARSAVHAIAPGISSKLSRLHFERPVVDWPAFPRTRISQTHSYQSKVMRIRRKIPPAFAKPRFASSTCDSNHKRGREFRNPRGGSAPAPPIANQTAQK